MSTERIADEIKFAYWVPNVSGGLVTSDIEQRTSWDYEYNKKLAQTAENNGFEYALSQVRYEASYGGRIPARIHELQPCASPGHREAQGDRRGASGTLAAGRVGETGRYRRSLVERSFCRQRRQWLVQGRVHTSRRAVARARRALSA